MVLDKNASNVTREKFHLEVGDEIGYYESNKHVADLRKLLAQIAELESNFLSTSEQPLFWLSSTCPYHL